MVLRRSRALTFASAFALVCACRTPAAELEELAEDTVGDAPASSDAAPDGEGESGWTGAEGPEDTGSESDSSVDDDFDLPPADLPPCCVETEVLFTEVAVAAGIDHSHGLGFASPGECLVDTLVPAKPKFFCSIEWLAGGAAAADVDGDGWVDLYVSRVTEPGILYRNLGDGTFANVTASAGLAGLDHANGVAFADVDNDGDLDLYITTIGELAHHLMINHDGWFVDEAEARGASLETGFPQTGTTAAWGDYDNDGWLDLYVGDWHTNAIGDQASHARLLRNLGPSDPGSFVDVTDLVGVNVDAVHLESETPSVGTFVLSAGWSDLDDDGWLDLLLTSDFGCSRLFWNDSDALGFPGFVDTTKASGVGTDRNGMGATVADFDGDGDLDWFVSAITGPFNDGNRLYANVGERSFVDVTDAVGVREAGWGWGSVFFDPDNDGDLDLAVTNGWRADGAFDDPLVAWTNEAGVMTPLDPEVGLIDEGQGRAMISFDYDRDGDLDLFVANMGGAPKLFRNDSVSSNRWLRVELHGSESNSDSLNAKLELVVGDTTQVLEYGGSSHYLGHSERIAHFGIGSADVIDALTVRWPASGAEVTLENITPNQVLEIVEPR